MQALFGILAWKQEPKLRRLRCRIGVGQVSMRVPESGKLEFDAEVVGERDGVEIERAFERGRDAGVGERPNRIDCLYGGR